MKLVHCLLLFTTVSLAQAKEAPATTKLQSADLYIDGQMKEKAEVVLETRPVEDDELKFFKNELENVKNLNKSFKQKSKTLAKMAEEAEQLKEQHLDYMENRIDWETAIDGYNQQANCMAKNPKDCSQFIGKKQRRRHQEKPQRPRQREEMPMDLDALAPLSFQSELEMPMAATTNFNQRDYIQGIDAVIAANSDLLSNCLNRYGRGSRDFSVVYAQLSLTASGNLTHLGIENPEAIPNREILSCVSTVLHSLSYPQAGRAMKVRKPFSFVITRS